MKLMNIKWKEESGKDISTLPTEMEVPDEYNGEGEAISDYLLEKTGCDHEGFEVEFYTVENEETYRVYQELETAEEAKEWAAAHQDQFTDGEDIYVRGYRQYFDEDGEYDEEETIFDVKVFEAKGNDLVIVAVTYSFDPEVVTFVFDDYKKACDFIEEDFEREKKIDLEENGWEIDEEVTKCEEGFAVLGTIYPSDSETQTTTWTVATVIDKRR